MKLSFDAMLRAPRGVMFLLALIQPLLIEKIRFQKLIYNLHKGGKNSKEWISPDTSFAAASATWHGLIVESRTGALPLSTFGSALGDLDLERFPGLGSASPCRSLLWCRPLPSRSRLPPRSKSPLCLSLLTARYFSFSLSTSLLLPLSLPLSRLRSLPRSLSWDLYLSLSSFTRSLSLSTS